MKKILFLITLIFSFSVQAEFVTTTITAVGMQQGVAIPTATNSGFVSISVANPVDPADCVGVTFALRKDLPNFKEMYTLALIASTTGQRVKFSIHNTHCSTAGKPKINGDYPMIIFMQLLSD